MLCVANLPISYTEEQFKTHVSAFGTVIKSFLMRCEAGQSKGYGFVNYAYLRYNIVEFQWKFKAISGLNVWCKFVSIHKLQSKCLWVENLPADCVDMIKFREVCSAVAIPTFCQIGVEQWRLQNWGLVEYTNWKDAEKSQKHLSCIMFDGKGVKVTYCMPGESAFYIMQSYEARTKPKPKPTSLLTLPSRTELTEHMTKMGKRNDQFSKKMHQVCLNALKKETFHEAVDIKGSTSGVLQVTNSPKNCTPNVKCLTLPNVLPPTHVFLPPVSSYSLPMTNGLPPTTKSLHSLNLPPSLNVMPPIPQVLPQGPSNMLPMPNGLPPTPKFLHPGSLNLLPPMLNVVPPTRSILPQGPSHVLPMPSGLPPTPNFLHPMPLNLLPPMLNVMPPTNKVFPQGHSNMLHMTDVLSPAPEFFNLNHFQPKDVSPRSFSGKKMRFSPYSTPTDRIQHKRPNHTSFPPKTYPHSGFHPVPQQPMFYPPNVNAPNTTI